MKSFSYFAVLGALASIVAGSPLEVRQNGNKGGNKGGNNGGKADPQKSLTLEKSQIGSNLSKTGLEGGDPGQVASLTSENNFINFCLTTGQKITNGLQVVEGSCNPIPMGSIVAKAKMPSCVFEFPKNLDTIQPNKDFTIRMKIKNLETGLFTNPLEKYYAAPQQVNGQGFVRGHSHVVIQSIRSLDSTDIPDPTVFDFFKGFNAKAKNGVLTADVPGGLKAGFYRMCSINTAANHQPVLANVAQHGHIDTCSYFTVSNGNGGNGGNGNGNGGNKGGNNGGNGNNGNKNNGNKGKQDVQSTQSTGAQAGAGAQQPAAQPSQAPAAQAGNGNLQKFTQGLGGILAPTVTKKGNQFTVNGQTLGTLADALRRSCDTQHASCIGRVGKQGVAFKARDCDSQRQKCLAA